jgi:hypothetical protein
MSQVSRESAPDVADYGPAEDRCNGGGLAGEHSRPDRQGRMCPRSQDQETVHGRSETGPCLGDLQQITDRRTGARPHAGLQPCPADPTVGLRPGSERATRTARC